MLIKSSYGNCINVARVLYISYTGLLEPLGQSQVLQYLLGLSSNHDIELISFEKPAFFADTDQKLSLAKQLADAGIRWHPLTYHKRFSLLATAYDLGCMLKKAFQLERNKSFDIVHCRSYVAATAGAILKKRCGTRFIFDMRGFWADERVDGGIWKTRGLLHRSAKRVEESLLLSADYLISLTSVGIREIEKFPCMQDREIRASVIPTCTNLEKFKPQNRIESESGKITVGAVGSVGTWNHFDAVLECFKQLVRSRPDANLLILNRNEHKYIQDKIAEHSVDAGAINLRSVEYNEVPNYMGRVDFGLFFIKPLFSKKASAPTKLGEFLACGIPCLTNAGVGDMDEILQSTQTGVCIEEFSPQAFDDACKRMLALLEDEGLPQRCRQTAEKYFSLEKGIAEYHRIYRELSE